MLSTPGVYIEEESSLSLSINAGATAVPVIIGIFRNKDGTMRSLAEGCIRIANWMEFESVFQVAPCSARVEMEIEPEEEQVPERPGYRPEPLPAQGRGRSAARAPGDYLFRIDTIGTEAHSSFALRHYFDNGGGVCYLLSVAPDDGLVLSEGIPEHIRKHPEISLLVPAVGRLDLADGFFWQIQLAFQRLQNDDRSYFLIIHGETADDFSATALGERSQTGFYAPYLYAPYQYQRQDERVEIAGYVDGEENEQGEVTGLTQLATRNPALYRAICTGLDQRLAALPVLLPPAAAVAGAYARTDRERGAWKAPANVPLRSVSRLYKGIGDDEHGQLNDIGINVIRWMSDRGAVIAGARTLDVDSEEWRYIPVRRLFSTVERDLRNALRPLVFEPNSPPTWERARAAIDIHLRGLWRKGALLGDTEAQAYFVRIGKGLTMTDEDIAEGRMILRIGMAAVRPAEFIVLEFTQNMSGV